MGASAAAFSDSKGTAPAAKRASDCGTGAVIPVGDLEIAVVFWSLVAIQSVTTKLFRLR